MATGPFHYAEAEMTFATSHAQAHATLALAAATAHILPSHDWAITLSPASDESS